MIIFFPCLLIVSGFLFLYLGQIFCQLKKPKQPGFFHLNTPKGMQFFPLSQEMKNLEEFAEKNHLSLPDFKVWSKISINLSLPKGLYVEDRNFKPILMKNRRWARRSLIQNGDVLDIQNYSFSFFDPAEERLSLSFKKSKPSGKENFSENKPHEEAERKIDSEMFHYPVLRPVDPKKRSFFLSKSVNYVGRSYTNDIVIRSHQVAAHQAKITVESGKVTLTNLASDTKTFVNGKRVSERVLFKNDEISFDNQKFIFSTSIP